MVARIRPRWSSAFEPGRWKTPMAIADVAVEIGIGP